ncbi:MAG TPA: hypothetical protein VFI95_02585 [Terriglobales bacterium]|nr:hypothetical protein [Terriglobales bacterium]
MAAGRKAGLAILVIVILGGLAAWVYFSGVFEKKPLTLRGAVIRQDSDPRRELPIADAEITVTNTSTPSGDSQVNKLFSIASSDPATIATAVSEVSGFFSVTLPREIRRGRSITFTVHQPDYRPLTVNDYVGDKVFVLRMEPLRKTGEEAAKPAGPEITLSNLLIRYSEKATTTVNIGSAVRIFEVENKGNVACNGHHPCSPDGRWKAAVGSVALDAGPGNEFQNARASCIAGPCPFTEIDFSGLRGARNIRVSARVWSDTATFLVEAEVVHPAVSDVERESHPFMLGRAMNFTVPPSAEGVSIQAEMNGETIVFPLGPALILTWADCRESRGSDQAKVYRCELKPGYRFP